MASITRYTTSAGATRWTVRYRQPDGSQTQKRGFRTKRDAELFSATTEVKKATGEYVAPSRGRVTVGELASDWLARKRQSRSAAHCYRMESVWRVHVEPRWGAVSVADVDLLGVETWIAAMIRAGTGAATVRQAHGMLAGVLGDAVKGKRLAVNPAKGVENLPRPTVKRHIYLTADDVHRLADESGPYRALVLVLAYCGLRWGEATALRVRDVEFLRRRLSIAVAVTRVGSRTVVGTPKSGKPRSVPVPGFVLDALSVQCAGKAPGDLVFPGPDGGYLPHAPSWAGWFHGAVKRAGVQRITPHDLRHTCASLAVSAGVSVLALQRMLGHARASMTLDVYSDLFDTDLDAVAVTMDDRYARESVSKACPRGTGEGG